MDHGAELWLGKDFYYAMILIHMETASSCSQQMPTYWNCVPQRVFSDGTFYSCSTFFSQLYTLHAKVNGTVFPLYLDCCPTRPRTPTYMYVRFFELFKNAVHERQSVLTPEHWMLDFEVAAHNSVRTSFPQTSIKGCFFHYTRCIWRKVQSSGLV